MSVFKHGARHGHRPTSEGSTKIQQRRNLDNLLKANIPDEEYRRANNGEIICVVCYHEPRFANIASLSNHRETPRHKGCARSRAEKEKTQNELAKHRSELAEAQRASLVPRAVKVADARLKQSVLAAAELPFFAPLPVNVIYDDASGHYWDPERHCWSLYPPGAIDAKAREVAEKKLQQIPLVGLRQKAKVNAPKWEPLPPPGPTCEQQAANELVAYEMKWREKGWKKDHNGKWMRDDGVEFESDEEAPPPPPNVPSKKI